MDKEFILCAALNFNGSIICGHRHSDCYKTLMDVVKVKDEDLPCEIIKALTSLNRYVDRKEGWIIAKETNKYNGA
jgi:flagellar biosynthesis regulator FlaF